MVDRKGFKLEEDLISIREEIFYQFQLFYKDVTSLLKQIAGDLANISEKIDRFHREIKVELEKNAAVFSGFSWTRYKN